jgi:hypothetical protein
MLTGMAIAIPSEHATGVAQQDKGSGLVICSEL